jgi:hypothetical protein
MAARNTVPAGASQGTTKATAASAVARWRRQPLCAASRLSRLAKATQPGSQRSQLTRVGFTVGRRKASSFERDSISRAGLKAERGIAMFSRFEQSPKNERRMQREPTP